MAENTESPAGDAARRAWRVARLERAVGEQALDDDVAPLHARVVDLDRKVAMLTTQLEVVAHRLASCVAALSSLGFAVCSSCGCLVRRGDPLAGFEIVDGVWFCTDHVARGVLHPNGVVIDRLAAWLVANKGALADEVVRDVLAASPAIAAAVLALTTPASTGVA